MKKTTKQVYFALVVEVEVAEDGTEKITGSWIDDERASATWNKQDIWVEPKQEWEQIYDHASTYEMTQEALQNAIAVIGKDAEVIDPCVYCGDSTAFGFGKFVNRLPVDYGWGCAECSGFMCDECDEQIYLDEDVTDKDESGHYHPRCLPLDQHYVDPEEEGCGCTPCELQRQKEQGKN